jgi:hypothetical protein
MDKPDSVKTASRTRGTSVECCTEPRCESGLKNHYFEGKRLTPDMFRIEQRYLVERRRLLNRAIHGWGVVYGYPIVIAEDKYPQRGMSTRVVRIGPGVALDECGRELVQPGPERLALGQVIVLDEKNRSTDPDRAFAAAAQQARKQGNDGPAICWLLSVHYAEQDVDPVRVPDPCECDGNEWDRICETIRFTLRRVPCDDCCAEAECALQCSCATGRCCDHDDDDDHVRDAQRDPAHQQDQQDDRHYSHRHPGKPHRRGGCRCICDHLTDLNPGEECRGGLCEIEEPCGRVRVDLTHGVPLACVTIARDDCDEWTFDDDIDACGPRRLVKRNDLLFDLVRGCDLTRIIDIGWKDWHRLETPPVPFDDFRYAMGGEGEDEEEYVTNKFWVTFSAPVRTNTLLPDCFAITVMSVDTEGGWWQPMRVPVVRLESTQDPADPPNHVRKATLVVDGSWLEDGCAGRHSVFLAGDTWVEIEIRGDLIVDCNGQPVDANASGLSLPPTGNGSPGGTFLSSFRVAQRKPSGKSVQSDTANRDKGASS